MLAYANIVRELISQVEVCMQLNDIPVGKTVTITKVLGEGAVRRRIFDMGITPNTKIYVRKVAPLGDPIEVTVRNYELSLRKEEAKKIEVKYE